MSQLGNDDVGKRLMAVAESRFGKAPGTLALESDLFESLKIDSYQALELLTEVEATFGIEIPDYEMQDVRTFASLAAVIRRRL